jgi:hypothetical protein
MSRRPSASFLHPVVNTASLPGKVSDYETRPSNLGDDLIVDASCVLDLVDAHWLVASGRDPYGKTVFVDPSNFRTEPHGYEGL